MRVWPVLIKLWWVGLLMFGLGALASAPSGAAGYGSSAPTIRITPTEGPPGTIVTISGYVPGGPDASQAARNPASTYGGELCFDGCRSGLVVMGQTIHWQNTPGYFTATLAVPKVPFLTTSGPQPLTPGTYAIGFTCLGPNTAGCALAGAQASTPFHLTGPTPQRCLSGANCAELSLSPTHGPAGTLVHIHGWAPLTEVIGTPMGYSLVVQNSASQFATVPMGLLGGLTQSLNGTISGTMRIPDLDSNNVPWPIGTVRLWLQATPNGSLGHAVLSPTMVITPISKVPAETIDLAPTTFRTTSSVSWAKLGTLRPSSLQLTQASPSPLSPVSSNTTQAALCTDGQINVVDASGQVHGTIATGQAYSVSDGSYPLLQQNSTSTCSRAWLDPGHKESAFAAFPAYFAKYKSAPPIYYVGFETTDDGGRWRPIPVPKGYTMGNFGGFRVVGQRVYALFGIPAASPALQPSVSVEVTTDGGKSWGPATLPCPLKGACLILGPYPSSYAGMGAQLSQPLLRPASLGRIASPTWPSQLSLAANASELATIGKNEVVLLAGNSSYPLRVSDNGGRTFSNVALPVPPTGPGKVASYSNLLLMPDGTLLVNDQQGVWSHWYRLRPGASAWKPVAQSSLPSDAQDLMLEGHRLWWLTYGQNTAPSVHSIELSSLKVSTFSPPSAARTTSLVLHYWHLIADHQYRAAYAMWAPGSPEISGRSYRAFKAGFANTRSISVSVGQAVPIDAALLEFRVPVHLVSVNANGKIDRFTGTIEVRYLYQSNRFTLYDAHIQQTL